MLAASAASAAAPSLDADELDDFSSEEKGEGILRRLSLSSLLTYMEFMKHDWSIKMSKYSQRDIIGAWRWSTEERWSERSSAGSTTDGGGTNTAVDDDEVDVVVVGSESFSFLSS